MASYIEALKIPVSAKTGKPLTEMKQDMIPAQYKEVFTSTKESTALSLSNIHYKLYVVACRSNILTAVNLIFMLVPFQLRILFYQMDK